MVRNERWPAGLVTCSIAAMDRSIATLRDRHPVTNHRIIVAIIWNSTRSATVIKFTLNSLHRVLEQALTGLGLGDRASGLASIARLSLQTVLSLVDSQK